MSEIIVSKNDKGKYIAYYKGDYNEETHSGMCFEGENEYEAVGKAVCRHGKVTFTSKTKA